MIKLAIFDLDGTILDTLEDLADSTNYALSVYHMPEHSIDEVRWFVGNGIHKLIERAVPEGSSDEQIEQVFTTFKEYYKDHCAVKTRPYDGIMELLKTVVPVLAPIPFSFYFKDFTRKRHPHSGSL